MIILLFCLAGVTFSLPPKPPHQLGNHVKWDPYDHQEGIRLYPPTGRGIKQIEEPPRNKETDFENINKGYIKLASPKGKGIKQIEESPRSAKLAPLQNYNKEKLGKPDEQGSQHQGDIKFPLPTLRNGILDEAYRWPNGAVAYQYDLDFDEAKKPMLELVMQDYFDVTGGCIRFVLQSDETSYIIFIDQETEPCSSNVGRLGGIQYLNLNQTCIQSFGAVQHELYHALGFFHETSRPDRDDYIIINYDSIAPENVGQFAKYSNDTVGTFGEPYDYGSLMHLSAHAFSSDGAMTIFTKDTSAQGMIGQRYGLSLSDLRKLKRMYNCDM